MTIIEAVAKAICDSQYHKDCFDKRFKELALATDYEHYARDAKAAILATLKAIEEPMDDLVHNQDLGVTIALRVLTKQLEEQSK